MLRASRCRRPPLVRGPARHHARQRVRTDRDLRRHPSRRHGTGARGRPRTAREAGPQRPRLHRRRTALPGAARCPRRDRPLRGLRRPRVRGRPRAHPVGVPARSAPPGRTALPQRRLRPLAAGRHHGVPRPPGQPGQDPRVPRRDRRDRADAAADPGRPRRRGGGQPPARPATGPGRLLHRPGPSPRFPAPRPAERRTARSQEPPGTPTERRLAAAWSTALGIPQGAIGGRDHFFDLGGTSLSAVKVAILLDRAISPKDLIRCPVLTDLAGLLDGRRPGTAPRAVSPPTEGPAHA